MNHPPVLSCYFGLDSLDDKWFQRNIDLSLENLGRRYNSLFNVDTDAQRHISLFLREAMGIAEVNAKKNDLISELKDLRWRCGGKYKAEINSFIKWAKSLELVDVKTLPLALNWKHRFENDCNDTFTKLRKRLYSIQEGLKNILMRIRSIRNLEVKSLKWKEYCQLCHALSFQKQRPQ